MSVLLDVESNQGICTAFLDIPVPRPKSVVVELVASTEPDIDPRFWPAVQTDLITQVRFRLADGSLTEWQPRNLLPGGDMADMDGSGIPDWVSVMRLRSSGNLIYADAEPPEEGYWVGRTRDRGFFVDRGDHPSGSGQSLRLVRTTSDGQDTAEMRLDLIPPDTQLTVCGWTKYDLGEETSMGVMARYHEFDSHGNRINKHVLLGDDDFHQPSGESEWRWRALSFTPAAETRRLGIYPIRMIGVAGTAWAADWEIREGSVHSGKTVFREDFGHWEMTGTGEVYGGALILRPEPLTVSTAVQSIPIEVKPNTLYSFSVRMNNDVPSTYDKTHQAWMSAYLEFYDSEMRFLDYCKVMSFRPTSGHPLSAAMRAPQYSRYVRFMFAASHISYGDRTGMDGQMIAGFSCIELKESAFDSKFLPASRGELTIAIPQDARKMEIRTFRLSGWEDVSPSFSAYRIDWH